MYRFLDTAVHYPILEDNNILNHCTKLVDMKSKRIWRKQKVCDYRSQNKTRVINFLSIRPFKIKQEIK